jgi:hypothetical protein
MASKPLVSSTWHKTILFLIQNGMVEVSIGESLFSEKENNN